MSLQRIFLIIGSYLFFCHFAVAQDRRTVALTGQLAPGTSASFTELRQVNINNSGQIAFQASFAGGSGVWSDRQGQLELIVRTGDPVNVIGSDVFINGFSFSSPQLNDAGEIAFSSTLTGDGVENGNSSVILTESKGSGLTLVVREGDLASATLGNFGSLETPIFNDSGQSAFFNRLSGVSFSNFSIWSEGSGDGLALIAREGSPAPGTDIGVNFRSFSGPRLSDLGETVFRAAIAGPGIGSFNDGGIWRGSATGVIPVVLAGDPAPGTDTGVVFLGSGFGGTDGGFRPTVINNMGQVAFFARLVGLPASGKNRGIWAERNGNLELVVRQGDRAPGIDGVNLLASFENILFNNLGQIAFIDQLSGADFGNNRAIWLEGPGTGLSLIAREGDPAPGSAGASFDDFANTFGSVDVLAINNSGQVAFRSNLRGAGPGIWATDKSGDLTLVARSGELLDVNDDPAIDDLRTILGLSFVTGQDGRQSGFNDSGQLAFVAFFTDGTSGIVVSDVVAEVVIITGDLNGDGVVSFLDIAPFVKSLINRIFLPEADINGDGEVNFLDVGPFVTLLLSS